MRKNKAKAKKAPSIAPKPDTASGQTFTLPDVYMDQAQHLNVMYNNPGIVMYGPQHGIAIFDEHGNMDTQYHVSYQEDKMLIAGRNTEFLDEDRFKRAYDAGRRTDSWQGYEIRWR